MENKKIIISCDTTIALTKEEILKENLYVIPLNAIVDGVEYHDSVDIDANKLSSLMRSGAKVTTSTPTLGEIEKYFDDLFNKTNADVIIHFTISSKLSSMYSLFTNFCNEKYNGKVKVVDSLSICCWMLNQVKYAKHLVSLGYDADTIINKVKTELVGTEDCAFIPDSLEYLKRGGRISPAVASIANLIGVLPILTFKDGVVGKKGMTRTLTKACINAIKEWLDNIKDFDETYSFVIVYTDDLCKEKVARAKDLIKELAPKAKIEVSPLSLNVTAHTGPGTVGIGIKKRYKA